MSDELLDKYDKLSFAYGPLLKTVRELELSDRVEDWMMRKVDEHYIPLVRLCRALGLSRPPALEGLTGKEIDRWRREFAIWRDDVLDRDLEAAHQQAQDADAEQANPSDNYADYRNGPGGPLLTATYSKEAFGVSGKDLSTDPEAKKHRRRNPSGRKGGDFVYRYTDVSRIANQKPDPKPPEQKKLEAIRDKIRSQRK